MLPSHQQVQELEPKPLWHIKDIHFNVLHIAPQNVVKSFGMLSWVLFLIENTTFNCLNIMIQTCLGRQKPKTRAFLMSDLLSSRHVCTSPVSMVSWSCSIELIESCSGGHLVWEKQLP